MPGVRRISGELLDRALELLDAPVDLVDGQQIVVKGLLLTDPFERLTSQPRPTGRPPALRRHPQIVAQHELSQAITRGHPVQPSVLPRPHQITKGLLLAGRDENLGQQSRRVQAGQSTRVSLIGLDPIPRTRRNQTGATTTLSIPEASSARSNPNPVGPAS